MHSQMDMGNGDMGSSHKCKMNMLFTWSTKDLCIVFHGWHVSGIWSLIFSLLAIVALAAGYELLRELTRRYEASCNIALPTTNEHESSSLLRPGSGPCKPKRTVMITKAILYGAQVYYSFFIMLLFMTYNGWVMLAVAVGAAIGYYMFSRSSPSKEVVCH